MPCATQQVSQRVLCMLVLRTYRADSWRYPIHDEQRLDPLVAILCGTTQLSDEAVAISPTIENEVKTRNP